MSKIRVLTVDDSTLMQRILKSALETSPDIELVGQAFDAAEARNLIKSCNPDLITLDVEMPGMNGLEFLERLMNARPMPVIMFSSHTAAGTEITLKALELGAVDFVQKPRDGLEKTLDYLKTVLVPKIIETGKSVPKAKSLDRTLAILRKEALPSDMSPSKKDFTGYHIGNHYQLIAIGASTGGVSAIREVLEGLPNNLPPIVITQHMPEGYTERFADRLSRDCAMTVVEGAHGMELKQGFAYIAPGTHHMSIVSRLNKYYIELNNGPTVSGHRPSVDFMFESISKILPQGRIISVILTGMGRDGAEGMLKLRKADHTTIGQNKETCVVYGMPKAAFEVGAVQYELPLDGISNAILDVLCNPVMNKNFKRQTK